MPREFTEVHLHEALDRVSVAIDYLEKSLGEHVLIQSDKEFELNVKRAVNSLADLYQKLGRADLTS